MPSWLDWTLPDGVTTYAASVDFLYYVILVITGIAFVIVEVGLIWFIIKYRARPGRKAHYTHGSMKAEVVWTAIPAVTVVILGIMSGGVWNHIRGRDSVPAGAIEIGVAAKQFEWNVTYAGPDGMLGTADDFTRRNLLRVPVDTPVVVNLTSEDVIHSLFIPNFRVKQDAVPGMTSRIWFEVMRAGEYSLACAELCGNGHTTMDAQVQAISMTEYTSWLQSESPTVASR
jgi:cytochrome c oxidase subunit 2